MPPPANARLVARSGTVRLFHRPGASPFTLIFFAPGHLPPAGPENWWGLPVARRMNYDALAFTADALDWYPAAAMQALIPEALALAKAKRVTYGASMGAYAALKYAAALGAEAAVAFSPQHAIDPGNAGFDERSERYFDPALHGDMVVRPEDLPRHALVAFDPDELRDREHARILAGMPGVRLAPLRLVGHTTARVPAEGRAVDPLIKTMLAGRTGAAARLLRRARGRLPSVLAAAGAALARRGHAVWAAEAFRRAREAGLGEEAIAAETRRMEAVLAARAAERAAAQPPEPAIPMSPEDWHARIDALWQSGDHAGATALATAAAAALPGDAVLQARLGHCAAATGDLPRSEAAFRAALALAPALDHAWLALLNLLWVQQRHQDGIEAARHATEALPGHAGPPARLALFLLASGDAPGAEQAARLALRGDRLHEEAWLALADSLYRQGLMQRAIERMREAVEALPDRPELHARLGHLLLGAGQRAAAARAFAAATALSGVAPHIWLGLTDALWQVNRIPEAAEAARAAVAQYPADPQLLSRLGQILLIAGDRAGAEAALATAGRIAPQDDGVRLAIADALFRQGRQAEAVAAAMQAAAELADSPSIHIRLGHLLLQAGALPQSLAAFERAVSLAPESPHAWVGLCEASRRSRRIKEAIAAYRKAEELGMDGNTRRVLRFQLFGEHDETTV